MTRRANPTLIGAFVVGALVLVFGAVFLLTGNQLFVRKERAVMHFSGSTYGLQVGAPVVFRGVRMGSVVSIGVTYDTRSDSFSIPVVADLERAVIRDVGGNTPANGDDLRIKALVDRGLRAQLSTQSLLTGQLYIDLDFRPGKPARTLGSLGKGVEIPTVSTTIQDLKNQLDGLDVRQLVDDVSAIAGSARALVAGPELKQAMADLARITGSIKHLSERLDKRIDPLADAAQATLGATRQAMDRVGTASDRVSGTAGRVSEASDRVTQVLAADSPLLRSIQQAADDLARTSQALRQATADDAPLRQNLEQTMHDLSRAARALRELADTLDRQPEVLVRGRPAAP
ncbi:MlaD family protein [Aquabacterium sp.]|uniref:MlaD family protein n=1 Tax=Aquabacterium sp. TaxID=1872578 RepID=UPI002C646A5C|nr:MlaD family protein [Aquabacterium sp.]HSW04601.1 MlaD family protein [Aquabacterium sp.]